MKKLGGFWIVGNSWYGQTVGDFKIVCGVKVGEVMLFVQQESDGRGDSGWEMKSSSVQWGRGASGHSRQLLRMCWQTENSGRFEC